jgi:hypothetical protein
VTGSIGRRVVAQVLGLLVLLSLLFRGPFAHADETASALIASPPRDVPLVLQPSAVRIPAVPATYQQRDLGWLRIAYAPSAHERVGPIIAEAESDRARLADELGEPILEHVEVRVARTAEEMAALSPVELPPPPYASGVAYPPLRLIVLTLMGPVGAEATDLPEVFRHELAHIALEDAVLGQHIPRWFNEGFAVHESGESSLLRVRTLWDATLSRTIIPLNDLDRGFPEERYEVSIAYAESADLVRFLMRDGDRARFASLIDRTRKGEDFDRSLGDAYGVDVRKLEYQWREEIAKRYSFLPVLTGGSLLWVAVIGLSAIGWIRKKRRDRATLALWAEEEAALQGPPVEVAPGEALGVRPERLRSLPKIEHDGTWHTLH